MRSTFRRALRGTLSAVSLLSFVALFLALQARLASWTILLGLAALGVATLVAAGGRPALRRLIGRGRSGGRALGEDAPSGDALGDDGGRDTAESDPETDWWLARLEPALDDSWNRWSEVVLTVGLAAIGVGSFALLVTHSGEEPPLGLLVTGTLGINGALMTLAFVFE